MNKSKISFKTVIAIIGAYAAYGIGSGFATGQEILQYFASWGPKGIVSALMGSALLMGVAFSILVRDGFLHNDEFKRDSDCFSYYGGRYIGGFIDIFSIALVLGVYVEVFAGCGATINQHFGLPAFAGTIVMGIGKIYLVILVLGIFTTLTGYTWLITDRFSEEGTARSRIICAVVVVIGIFAGSILTFNAIINVLFPIAGLVGMILTLLMVIKEIRIRIGRKG